MSSLHSLKWSINSLKKDKCKGRWEWVTGKIFKSTDVIFSIILQEQIPYRIIEHCVIHSIPNSKTNKSMISITRKFKIMIMKLIEFILVKPFKHILNSPSIAFVSPSNQSSCKCAEWIMMKNKEGKKQAKNIWINVGEVKVDHFQLKEKCRWCVVSGWFDIFKIMWCDNTNMMECL